MTSNKWKEQQKEEDSKTLFDSFKKIFKGDPKSKLSRVTSHKPHGQVRPSNSIYSRTRSHSEPDLFSESFTLDSQDIKLEPLTEVSTLMVAKDTDSSLKSKSFTSFDQQLKVNCPSKAAKTLGLDIEDPPKQKGKKDSFKSRKSGGSFKRFSMKSKDKEQKERRVSDMEVVHLPGDMPQKAAKTLGIETIQVPSKAAKTLGITSKTDETTTQTTEDFLRKIGAFAAGRDKVKVVHRPLRKQSTSPNLSSKPTTKRPNSNDMSTNLLLKKLVQLTPTEKSETPPNKPGSEPIMSLSRKRRIEAKPMDSPEDRENNKLSSTCSPGQQHHIANSGSCRSDHTPSTGGNTSSVTTNLQINYNKLLKSCENDRKPPQPVR